jgi:hypothetical protein
MRYFDGIETMSAAELQAMQDLERVNPDSPWGNSIRNVLMNPNPVIFRQLVCELKSEAEGHGGVMQSILGGAYHSIINL